MIDLDKIRMGYAILVKRKKGDLFGWGIEKRQIWAGFSPQDAQYTHIGISGGGQYLVDVKPPLSKISDITKDYKGRYIKIVRYNQLGFENHTRYKIAFWAATHTNLPYDFKGILAFVWGKIKERGSFWFCSENAAWAYRKEHPLIFGNLPPNKIMPAHFLNQDNFEIVWQGIIE